MAYSVVIVGAGRIAGGYDRPGDDQVLTHLHGISREPRFSCTGLVDCDPERAKELAARWGVPVASDLDAALESPVDMLVIATPDATHAHYLEKALGRDVSLVLCEKPLTGSFSETRSLVERFGAAGKALAVNYQRRFENSVQELRARIRTGTLGRPLAGVLWYSKGVLHNGSHGVDLLRYLFGEVQQAMGRRRVEDFVSADPSIGGTLRFADLDVELVAADERCFSLFELDLVFEKGRYRYTLGGMNLERYGVLPDPVFAGYQELQVIGTERTGLDHAMADVYRAFGDYLDKGGEVPGDARHVLGTQMVCEGLRDQPPGEWFVPGNGEPK